MYVLTVLQSTTMGGNNNYYSFLEIANNFSFIDGTITPSDYRYPTMNTFVPDMARILPFVASSPGILIMDGNNNNNKLSSWPLRSPSAICVDYYVCSVVQSYTNGVQINPFVNHSHTHQINITHHRSLFYNYMHRTYNLIQQILVLFHASLVCMLKYQNQKNNHTYPRVIRWQFMKRIPCLHSHSLSLF